METNKLKYLSINLQTILMEINNNTNIMNLLQSDTPLSPYPFNLKTIDTTSCEIRVYYPSINFKNNEVIQDVSVSFDIICAKDIWVINGDIRPYEIMKYIVNTFYKKSIFEVGTLHFKRMNHVTVNDSYDCIRLSANMMQL